MSPNAAIFCTAFFIGFFLCGFLFAIIYRFREEPDTDADEEVFFVIRVKSSRVVISNVQVSDETKDRLKTIVATVKFPPPKPIPPGIVIRREGENPDRKKNES